MARDQRRLAAIVCADVAGFSRLMGADEGGVLASLKSHLTAVFEPKIAEHRGRIVKTTGDGLLAEFASVVDAVRCAVEVQRGMAERNRGVSADERIDFRIGINVGDIIIDGDDIFGDGVNVTARLETFAEPGGICVSRAVRDQVNDKLRYTFEDLGLHEVKNIARAVRIYRLDLDSAGAQAQVRRWWPAWRSLRWRRVGVGILVLAAAAGAAWVTLTMREGDPIAAAPAMSVAVMPIAASPVGDSGVSRLAEAFTQSIASGLSREGGWATYPRPRVALASDAVADGSRGMAASEIARRVKVRYVLEGDLIRGSGGAYAASLRLLEANSGEQIWSQREAWQEADIAAESSAKLRRLTAQLRDAIQGADTRRAVAEPLTELSALELVLRVIDMWRRDSSLAGIIEARKVADEALRLEPTLIPALLIKSFLADRELDLDLDPSHRARILREYEEYTNRAISLDRTNPVAWEFRGIAMMYLGRWDAALEANATAIQLAPDKPDHYSSKAWLMSMIGRPDEALALVDRALGMDPDASEVGFCLRVACEAHVLAGQATQAIAACEKARGINQSDVVIELLLAAAYANAGEPEKALAAKAEATRIAPGHTIERLRAKRYSDHPEYKRMAEQYWYEGLRKAGLPER